MKAYLKTPLLQQGQKKKSSLGVFEEWASIKLNNSHMLRAFLCGKTITAEVACVDSRIFVFASHLILL